MSGTLPTFPHCRVKSESSCGSRQQTSSSPLTDTNRHSTKILSSRPWLAEFQVPGSLTWEVSLSPSEYWWSYMLLLPCPPLPPAWVLESLAAGAYCETFPTLTKDKEHPLLLPCGLWFLLRVPSCSLSLVPRAPAMLLSLCLSVYGIKNSTENSALLLQSASVSLLSPPQPFIFLPFSTIYFLSPVVIITLS